MILRIETVVSLNFNCDIHKNKLVQSVRYKVWLLIFIPLKGKFSVLYFVEVTLNLKGNYNLDKIFGDFFTF